MADDIEDAGPPIFGVSSNNSELGGPRFRLFLRRHLGLEEQRRVSDALAGFGSTTFNDMDAVLTLSSEAMEEQIADNTALVGTARRRRRPVMEITIALVRSGLYRPNRLYQDTLDRYQRERGQG